MSEFGDIQQSIGEFSGKVGLGIGYFMSIILFISAAVAIYFGLKKEESSNTPCDNKFNRCAEIDETCQNGKCTATQKTWLIGVAVFLILIGIGTILYCRWYYNFVHSSRTAAQIGAGLTEFGMLQDMLNPRNPYNNYN